MKKLSLFLWWRTEEKGEKEEEARQKNKWTNKQNPTMHEWKHPSSSTHCENRLVHPCPNCPELDSRKEKLKMINCDMVKSDWRRDWGGPEIRWRVIEGEIEVAGLRSGEGLLKERLRWQAWDQVKGYWRKDWGGRPEIRWSVKERLEWQGDGWLKERLGSQGWDQVWPEEQLETGKAWGTSLTPICCLAW